MDASPVAISGITGFIGRHLARRLIASGVPVTGISRSKEARLSGVSRWQTPDVLDLFGHRAVVNLSGEPVNCRWSDAKKAAFESSRTGATHRLVKHLKTIEPVARPKVLVSASGIGIYGDREDAILDEGAPPGTDYLAGLCVRWEAAAREAEDLGVRVALLRTGIVLGKGGAAFDQLRRLFRLGLGGKLGSGRQWIAWIHLEDQISAIIHALETPLLSGPLNLNAPHPERNVDFTRKFAAALHRPAILPVPGFALKLVLDGLGETMLGGQRAVPTALERSGFAFQFPTLEEALADLVVT